MGLLRVSTYCVYGKCNPLVLWLVWIASPVGDEVLCHRR